MSDSFYLAGHEIKPGTKERFLLYIGETPTSKIEIPVVVAHGNANSGRTFCITAGIHGAEYVGIEAATRLHRSLDPAKMNGTVVVLPTINVSAFQNPTAFVNPIDGLNPNRSFPGDADGSITRRLVHVIYNEVIPKANFHVDLHGGDLTESLQPFTIFSRIGNPEVDKKSEEMAKIYGVKNIWVNANYSGTSSEAVSKLGIPSIVAEAGKLGTYSDEDIQTHVTGLNNLLMYAGILEGKPKPPPNQSLFDESIYIRPKHGGVFHPNVQAGEKVSKDQTLAYITDIWGDTIEEIRSPTNGVVRILLPKRTVNTGDEVYRIWVAK